MFSSDLLHTRNIMGPISKIFSTAQESNNMEQERSFSPVSNHIPNMEEEREQCITNGRTNVVNHARNTTPKKRVVMLSCFLACLSFIIIICNHIMTFISNLLRDDAFLNMINKYLTVHNITNGNHVTKLK